MYGVANIPLYYLVLIYYVKNLNLSKYIIILYRQLRTLYATDVLTSCGIAAMWNNSRHAQIAHRLLKNFGDLKMHRQQ